MCPNLHKNNHNKLIIHWQCSHTAFPLTESIDWMTLKIQQIYVYRSFVQSHLYWALCFIIWQRGKYAEMAPILIPISLTSKTKPQHGRARTWSEPCSEGTERLLYRELCQRRMPVFIFVLTSFTWIHKAWETTPPVEARYSWPACRCQIIVEVRSC